MKFFLIQKCLKKIQERKNMKTIKKCDDHTIKGGIEFERKRNKSS